MDLNVEGRVTRGAEFLDGRLGTDWRGYLDTDALDIQRPDQCVPGQLAHRHPRYSAQAVTGSGYCRVLKDFNKDDDWARKHGFDILGHGHSDGDGCICFQDALDLKEAWTRVIRGGSA